MKSSHRLIVLFALSITVTTALAQTLPADINPDTGNRFPAIKREALNDAGRKLYDARGVTDGFGPGAIRLYSPPVAETMTTLNDYLRRKSGLEPRLVELAILVTAREMDCAYVWTAHEPPALKAGLSQNHRRRQIPPTRDDTRRNRSCHHSARPRFHHYTQGRLRHIRTRRGTVWTRGSGQHSVVDGRLCGNHNSLERRRPACASSRQVAAADTVS